MGEEHDEKMRSKKRLPCISTSYTARITMKRREQMHKTIVKAKIVTRFCSRMRKIPQTQLTISALDLQFHENSRELFKVGIFVTLTQLATKVQTTPYPIK